MPALELLSGFTTAAGTTFTALTMAAGNSNTIRLARDDTKIWLVEAWVDSQANGNLRIRSPQMHDNVQGIRLVHVASEPNPLLPFGRLQDLKPQDTLTLELTGSAVAGDIDSAGLLVYYEDLPGIAGKFIDKEEMMRRAVDVVGVENTLALGTAGGYSGEEAINAEFDLLRANTDYALVGYLVQQECASIRWRSVDFGNLGVGGPGLVEQRFLTQHWFELLSTQYGIPMIPVFNSANKSGTLIDGVQDENGVDVTVTSILVELAPA